MSADSASIQFVAKSSLSASLNAEAALSAQLGAGAAVVNDYLIQTEEIEDGHRLTITRGSEVQTFDLKNGEPGSKDAVIYTPQALTTEQQTQARANVGAASAERVEAVEAALPGKLSEPAEWLAVGKYFRVAAIDENGHAVLEAVDAQTEGLAITPNEWPAWTADEQAAARERMDAASPYRHIASIEIEESGVTCIGIETDENGATFELKNVVIYGFFSKLSASAGVAVAINSVKTTYNGANNIAKSSSLGLGSNGAAVEISINRHKYWRSSIVYSTGVPDGYITQSTGYTIVSHRGASAVRANEWEYLTALSICVDNTDGFGIGTKFDIWGR